MEQILLTGVGGQGIIISSIIIAEAAVNNGKEVVQLQSYSAAARGDDCEAEVIISNSLIDDLEVTKADIIVELSQNKMDKYSDKIYENTIFIVDTDLVTEIPYNCKVNKIPFRYLSINKFGSPIFTNMIMLGYLVRFIKSISLSTVKEAIKKRLSKTDLEKNLKALNFGYDIIDQKTSLQKLN